MTFNITATRHSRSNKDSAFIYAKDAHDEVVYSVKGIGQTTMWLSDAEWQAFRSLLKPCADADYRIEPKEER